MQTDATVELADATLEYVHFDRVRAANGANQRGGAAEEDSAEAVSYTHLTLPTTPYV